MSDVPTIDHPTDRPNFSRVYADGTTYYFSYRTCIAFDRYNGRGLVVHENIWSVTTGKHLNYLDNGDKANRVDSEEFARLLNSERETI